MEKESLFLSYVRFTLKKWVGFQAALEEGMGGPHAKEKELWLGSEIENYFKMYNDVTPNDIEDYLGEMIENEFDTLFEDGSLLEVSKSICKAYELSLVDPNSSIFKEALKKSESVSSPSSKKSVQNVEITSEKSISKDMAQLSVNGTDDDEWTTVTRKGHKK